MLLNQPAGSLSLYLALAVVLIYALAADLHSRKITNRAWIIMAAALTVPRLLVAITNPAPALPLILWGLGIMLLAWIFWLTGTWAGADAKGTMILAWAIPIQHTGHAWIHPLMISIPVALAGVLLWQRWKPGAVPFFAFYTPSTILALLIFWI